MTADAIFKALHAACTPHGARLFTVSALDPEAGIARRAYTSHPEDYPVSGVKPVFDDAWSQLVLGRGQSFVANTTAEFAPLFPDHAQINALGCHSAMNIPVARDDGRVVACVNILDVEGHFTPDRIAAFSQIVAASRRAILEAIAATPMA